MQKILLVSGFVGFVLICSALWINNVAEPMNGLVKLLLIPVFVGVIVGHVYEGKMYSIVLCVCTALLFKYSFFTIKSFVTIGCISTSNSLYEFIAGTVLYVVFPEFCVTLVGSSAVSLFYRNRKKKGTA